MSVTVDGETRSGPMHDVDRRERPVPRRRDEDRPEAEPDDGLFDVLLIGDMTKRDLC